MPKSHSNLHSTPSFQSPDTSQTLTVGYRIGEYRIEFLLGSGGMAEVYYAIDQQLDRPVALKILRPKLATDETYLQRFLQEAKAAAALVHPNIVQIYAVGQEKNLRYIAQEYVPGTNLRNYLSLNSQEGEADRQLPLSEALSILLQILSALTKSASIGIIHRDIKPENIMLTRDGDVKVADFGLARLPFREDPRLTDAGMTLGTPMYMSPEQIQGGQVDVRSDLYSLGVTLFHILFGHPLYQGDTPLSLAMQHVQGRLPKMESLRESLPSSLIQLLKRLLAKSPNDRFESPVEVLDFLHEHRRKDLAAYWPERTVPFPGVSVESGGPSHATQALQALLRDQPPWTVARRLLLMTAITAWLGLVFFLGYAMTDRRLLPADDVLKLKDQVFKGVPKQADVKAQYEWALLDRSTSRIAKWEAVESYFPRSESLLNRMYAGLANLQLARAYQDAGELDLAMQELQKITGDAEMLPLVQAYGWLQKASIGHSRRDNAEIRQAVDQALRLREVLSKNQRDVEQLDQVIRAMPPDIELYWTPNPTDG